MEDDKSPVQGIESKNHREEFARFLEEDVREQIEQSFPISEISEEIS